MKIQVKRGLAADAPVLDVGEPGYATDTRDLKIGNGTDTWDDLPALGSGGGGSSPVDATAIIVTPVPEDVAGFDINDATYNVSTTGGSFDASYMGATVTGPNIPDGTEVVSVPDADTLTLSQVPEATTSGVTLWIARLGQTIDVDCSGVITAAASLWIRPGDTANVTAIPAAADAAPFTVQGSPTDEGTIALKFTGVDAQDLALLDGTLTGTGISVVFVPCRSEADDATTWKVAAFSPSGGWSAPVSAGYDATRKLGGRVQFMGVVGSGQSIVSDPPGYPMQIGAVSDEAHAPLSPANFIAPWMKDNYGGTMLMFVDSWSPMFGATPGGIYVADLSTMASSSNTAKRLYYTLSGVEIVEDSDHVVCTGAGFDVRDIGNRFTCPDLSSSATIIEIVSPDEVILSDQAEATATVNAVVGGLLRSTDSVYPLLDGLGWWVS